MRTGQGVTVAVIDSGVNPHGTAIFAAIQEKAPSAEIFAVRVFEDRLRVFLAGVLRM